MKKILGVAFIAILLAFGGHKAEAQNLKFGHINSDELLQALPEFDSASVKLESFRKDLINAMELMSVEFNNKNETYNKENKNWTDVVKQTKEQELVDINRRIQEFQQNAQTQLQEKQTELFQPIYAKVDKAIKDVGKENGFVYIFDIKGLLYFDAAKSTDILPLAKTKLGIKETAVKK
ncbi:MAG TPA: OmpH family outer membrane protein [Bacteroidales bacterium]|jgi:outer membrane protein|nr:OmpH family outer membrane protein [Bacteroidales bacterium]